MWWTSLREETKYETERFAEEVWRWRRVSVYEDSKDYCKEAAYDYCDLPKWARSKAGLQEFLSDDNPNHYRLTCITLEEWWPDVKDCKVESWGIEIKGHGDPVIWIYLVEEEKNEK